MSAEDVFVIETPNLTLKITLEEIGRLYIHEEIIPGILAWLVDKIRRDGVFKDPIIVDEKTNVVLDGMHRVAAAREIGFKYIPVCLVDYDNPSIGLYAWSRVVKVKESARHVYRELENAEKSVFEVFPYLGFRLVSIPDVKAGLSMLARREISALAITQSRIVGAKYAGGDIKSVYDSIKRVEVALENRGFEIAYYTERDALDIVARGDAVATIIPPTIRKDEVRSIALRGEVFIHKATRHVIPARPMNINVPLDWLSGSIELGEVRRMLTRYLSGKKVRRLPPGTVLDRRYEEEVYYFE